MSNTADVYPQEILIMNTSPARRSPARRTITRTGASWIVLLCALSFPRTVHASLFHGETLDAVANGIAWVVLVVAPIVGIIVFWLIHILPEKIAEKRKHPQAKAIQCVCLLSLCFGGLLWPIAWLWAYTKPVLHKMAYGTDVDETHGHGAPEPEIGLTASRPGGGELDGDAKRKGGRA